nr:GNAT family N-acetyltransferase [Tractidigestivibacter montrealensis]
MPPRTSCTHGSSRGARPRRSLCARTAVRRGFVLFFHNFSTFLGRAGIYLEDLYVTPEYRGRGYGKGLLRQLARIEVERGCMWLEWWCLDWNKPSIDFYLSLGAEPMKDWTVYRIAGDTLAKLAQ